jgi:hypothetical protein
MSYRFTNTEKWTDSWFSNLTQLQMLLFIYLCDNCDIAGFIEINYKRWANDLNSSLDTIEGASKGLQRGLIYSNSNDCIFIKNYLKHQKNLPLNESNKAHLGILRRFDLYKEKFDIKDVNEFIEGASKGLASPTGNGNGNGNEEGKDKKTTILDSTTNWRESFKVYKDGLRKVFNELISDEKWIKEKERYHPNIDICLSIEKSCVEFWATEAGWKNKKATKTVDIDWKKTLTTAIDLNKVYKQKIQGSEIPRKKAEDYEFNKP